MAHNEVVKRNTSGMQVIKTLQVLLEDNYSMQELIARLNANEKESIFNNSVISKYINTCRYCGIEIPKINNKYYVANIPFGLNLTEKESELIGEIQDYAKKFLTTKPTRIFENFIAKLNKYSNRQIARVEKGVIDIVFENFYKAIKQRKYINLIFKSKVSIEAIPLEIIDMKDKKSFKIIDDNANERIISVEKISGLEILEKKFKNQEIMVIYKLYGGLASRYTLRENEEVQESKLPDEITIINKCEDKESLLSRLLRYDSKCEIISPKEFREEMKSMLDDMLRNYGE